MSIFTGDRIGETRKVRITVVAPSGDRYLRDGFITVNCDEQGAPREVFLHGFRNFGDMMSGWCDAFAIMLSFALQADVSLETLVRKFMRQRFDPQGETDDPEIPWCWSIPDYVITHLGLRYGDETLQQMIREERNQA